MDFTSERNEFLLRSFREAIAAQSKFSLEKAFKGAAEAPAPRFWVSEARAAAIIGHMLAGDDVTAAMNPAKKKMFREIFGRFLKLREEDPGASVAELCYRAVNEEAPESYISWHRARTLIYQEMSRKRKGEI